MIYLISLPVRQYFYFTHERVRDPNIYCNLLFPQSLGRLVSRVNLSKVRNVRTPLHRGAVLLCSSTLALGVAGIYAILREIELSPRNIDF
jgi:hypothetical protein